MREYYNAAELAAFNLNGLANSKKNILKRARNENWTFRNHQGLGGGKEYHIYNLPEEARNDLAKKLGNEAWIAGATEGKKARLKEEMIEAARQKVLQDGMAKFAALPEENKNNAEARANILDHFNTFVKTQPFGIVSARKSFVQDYNSRRIINDEFIRSRIKTISDRSLCRWVKALKEQGIYGLTYGYARTKGVTVFKNDAKMKEFIKAFLIDHPHSSAKHVLWGMSLRFSKSDIPALRTVQRWVTEWKEKNKQLYIAMKNPDMWKNKYQAATGSCSEHVTKLNQLWEYDSTPTDVMLSDGKRHNIVGVIDVYSRRLKLLISRSSSSEAVALITRKCLLEWGVPESVKTDNGKDYVSKRMMRIFEHLNIEQSLCQPFTPEGKPHIERAFKTFSHDLMELLPGYIGHNIVDRKDIEARKSFAQRIMGQGQKPIDVALSAEELQEFCDKWTDSLYAHTVHGGLKGKTPYQMIATSSGLRKTIKNERALDILLSEAPGAGGFRNITKKGIHIDGATYDSYELAGYEDQRVRILYDESEYGEVYVFDEEGQFVCKAMCPERAGVSRKEVAGARKKRQKKILADSKRATKQLSKEYGTKNIVHEILYDRAKDCGKLVEFPQVTEDYITPALNEASIALKHTPKARELTDQEKAVMEQIAKDEKQAKKVVKMPETSGQRYVKWTDIDARIADGAETTPEEREFWKNYQMGSEYKTQKKMEELLKEDFNSGANVVAIQSPQFT
ncbi:MAG: DDE-type integrase/transposase/recombinase [Alphaproteobacteria bacterium]|nr:DDE-type integrase/transposase/recombinase [Alphaproteobacteria bacterium]